MMKRESSNALSCKVCLVPHNEEIHQATLDVRKWYRGQVTRGFEVEEETPVQEQMDEPRVA